MTSLISKHDLKPRKGIDFTLRYLGKLIRQGKFRRPVAIGGGRRKVFIEAEIDEYIAGKIAARDAEAL